MALKKPDLCPDVKTALRYYGFFKKVFGHEKGSFTGAVARRKGRFELAHGGTLFLDEIGDISLTVQVKRLRFLEEREFERVGGNKTFKVDVRIVSATHRDLTKKIADGSFREDLYYRLNVVEIRIPALRERPADLPVLAQHFLKKYALQNAKDVRSFSDEAMSLLQRHPWPGNVRQLENAIERAVVLTEQPVLNVSHFPTLRGALEPVKQNGYLILVHLSNIELYYTSPELIKDNLLILSGEEFHHSVNVMRNSVDDLLYVTNGIGSISKVQILKVRKNELTARIINSLQFENKLNSIWFCIPILKNPDRLKFVFEKCVELGITNFILFSSKHSISKKVKPEKSQNTLLSAMKQSLRAFLPKILSSSFNDIIELDGSKILFDQNANKKFEGKLDFS